MIRENSGEGAGGVFAGKNIRYAGVLQQIFRMLSADLIKLERTVRNLAKSRASFASVLRLHLRSAWLGRCVRDLFRNTTPQALDEMSEQEANDLQESLNRMRGGLAEVAEQIPFDRKLPVHLRPLRSTYQSLFILNNATTAALAAVTLKLEGEVALDLGGIALSSEEVLEVRDRMLSHAPGWLKPEMGIYDQL